MEAEEPTIEYIEAIAAAKKQKSEEENKTAHANNEKAAEEARRKAEEELKRHREEMEKSGGFPVDEFFSTVFNVPEEESDNSSDANEDGENTKNSDEEK